MASRAFVDRTAAGRALGARLAERPRPGAVVLGLPRGGVVVAAGVAGALGAELDVLPVRKLGLPGRPELAMGAVAAAGGGLETVRVEEVLAGSGVSDPTFAEVRDAEVRELRRREAAYRAGRRPPRLVDREVVLVDDGLATGATMRAAIAAVRAQRPARVTVAVPVGSPRVCAQLRELADELVCLVEPARFRSVDQVYGDFSPTSDAEVRAALGAADPQA